MLAVDIAAPKDLARLPMPLTGSTFVLPVSVKTSTTTLKVPRALKARIARLAKKKGRTPHGFMLDALERQTARDEKLEDFLREARAAGKDIEGGGDMFAADDVHDWLDQLARSETVAPPKPWRG